MAVITAVLAFLASPALCGNNMLAAQEATAPSQNARPSPSNAATRHATPPKHSGQRHHAVSAHAKPAPAGVSATAPALPPKPQVPDWPANQQPSPAHITWDSHGLQIVASNSSLDQILREVGADIGATVTGLSQDQRVFGTYGPGSARDVLDNLLDGTGYNVLMIGDQGNGAPRQILLSNGGGAPGGTQPGAIANPQNPNGNQNGDENGDTEEQPQQEDQPQPQPMPAQPPPVRTPFGNGAPPRSPQAIQQEMQRNNPQ